MTTIIWGNMTGRISTQDVLADLKLHEFCRLGWVWPFDCNVDNPVVYSAMNAFAKRRPDELVTEYGILNMEEG